MSHGDSACRNGAVVAVARVVMAPVVVVARVVVAAVVAVARVVAAAAVVVARVARAADPPDRRAQSSRFQIVVVQESNIDVERYRSPKLHAKVTRTLPLFSGRAAILAAAHTFAPVETPAKIPSLRAS